MNCCACDCADSKDTDSVAPEENLGCRLQFMQAGKSIQHPLKAVLNITNADAFAADLHVSELELLFHFLRVASENQQAARDPLRTTGTFNRQRIDSFVKVCFLRCARRL